MYSIFFGGLELEFVSSLSPGAERLGMDAKCRAITGGGGLGVLKWAFLEPFHRWLPYSFKNNLVIVPNKLGSIIPDH